MLARTFRRVGSAYRTQGTRRTVRTVRTDAQPPTDTVTHKDIRGLSPDVIESITGLPADQVSREVLIFRPRANHMQSGARKTKQWQMQFTRTEQSRWTNPIMGWTASRDPLNSLVMKFASREEAIQFAEQNGLNFKVEEDWLPDEMEVKLRSRDYGDSFKYIPVKENPTADDF